MPENEAWRVGRIVRLSEGYRKTMIGVPKGDRIRRSGSVGREPKNELWTAGMVSESDAWDRGMFTGKQGLEYWNGAGKRNLLFLVYQCSVLAGGVPVKVELVEELGPVSIVRSGTADLRQNVVYR